MDVERPQAFGGSRRPAFRGADDSDSDDEQSGRGGGRPCLSLKIPAGSRAAPLHAFSCGLGSIIPAAPTTPAATPCFGRTRAYSAPVSYGLASHDSSGSEDSSMSASDDSRGSRDSMSSIDEESGTDSGGSFDSSKGGLRINVRQSTVVRSTSSGSMRSRAKKSCLRVSFCAEVRVIEHDSKAPTVSLNTTSTAEDDAVARNGMPPPTPMNARGTLGHGLGIAMPVSGSNSSLSSSDDAMTGDSVDAGSSGGSLDSDDGDSGDAEPGLGLAPLGLPALSIDADCSGAGSGAGAGAGAGAAARMAGIAVPSTPGARDYASINPFAGAVPPSGPMSAPAAFGGQFSFGASTPNPGAAAPWQAAPGVGGLSFAGFGMPMALRAAAPPPIDTRELDSEDALDDSASSPLKRKRHDGMPSQLEDSCDADIEDGLELSVDD